MKNPFSVGRLALATPALLWLVCLVLSVVQMPRMMQPLIFVEAPRNDDGYPTLRGFQRDVDPGATGLELGDRILQVGETELQGVGPLGVRVRIAAEARRGDHRVPVVVERGGSRQTVTVDFSVKPFYWPLLLASLVYGVAGILLLLRSPESLTVRLLFFSFLLHGFRLGMIFHGPPAVGYAAFVLDLVTDSLYGPVTFLAFCHIPPEVAPRGKWIWMWPWVFALRGPLAVGTNLGVFLPPDVAQLPYSALTVAFVVACVTVLTRNYRRCSPIGRRQVKWILYGTYLAAIPSVAGWVGVSLDPPIANAAFVALVAASVALFPLTVLVAILRYDLFDIDRLIGTTATYNLLVVALVGGGLVVVPRGAKLVSDVLGLPSFVGQVFLSLVLVALWIPAYRRLRPLIDRIFFRERYAVERGVGQLLGRIADSHDAQDLFRDAGERFDALLRPQSSVIYARTGEAFQPVVARGQAIPPAIAAKSTLIQVLERHGAPLAVVGARRDLGLPPSDAALVAGLGAHVLLPLLCRGRIEAFMVLGEKHSGDIYTPTDLALLNAVATSLATQLELLDQAELLVQTRAMEEALRSYVPGAIADEIARGGEKLDSGEREVTVLFVDIRGYTAFAEGKGVREIFSTVNRYTEVVSQIVRDRGGAVVEFNGDGMMAVFGAPRALEGKEGHAVLAGREIVSTVGEITGEVGQAEASLSVGVGVATGPAFVGNIRAVDRVIWSAIGNTTNLAARLQSLTRKLQAAMVIDAPTRLAAGPCAAPFVARRQLTIRGRSEPLDVYCLPLEKGEA